MKLLFDLDTTAICMRVIDMDSNDQKRASVDIRGSLKELELRAFRDGRYRIIGHLDNSDTADRLLGHASFNLLLFFVIGWINQRTGRDSGFVDLLLPFGIDRKRQEWKHALGTVFKAVQRLRETLNFPDVIETGRAGFYRLSVPKVTAHADFAATAAFHDELVSQVTEGLKEIERLGLST